MRPPFFAVFLVSLAILVVVPSWSYAGVSGGLRVGAARIDITPKKPVRMSGYASRKDLSTGVHDPLSARALAFEAGNRRLVLVSTNLIGFHGRTAETMRVQKGEGSRPEDGRSLRGGDGPHEPGVAGNLRGDGARNAAQ